jgi:hypothetical protein
MLEGDQLAAFLDARCGKLTASRMADAMDFRKDGKPGAKRIQLLKDLLAERVTGNSVRHYTTDAMIFGSENEQAAKDEYEAATGNIPMPCGTIDHPAIDGFAATPDSLLAGGGLLETKVPTSATFVEWRLAGVVPEQHKPQLLAQLACTGRRWVDFAAFDPRIKDPKLRLMVRRFEPTSAEIEDIENIARDFLATLDSMFEAFTQRAA